MKKRIVCVGNRYRPEDDAGPRVYDRLAREPVPAGVEVIDGGIAGLGLLRWLEGAEHVVFVDAVSGFAEPGGVVLLTAEQAAANAGTGYGHEAGLGYLLRAFPRVHEGAVPRVTVVGLETPADDCSVARAARICLVRVAEDRSREPLQETEKARTRP
jgi:hydrogenase maturation protease